MRHKKRNWDNVPWTPFEEAFLPEDTPKIAIPDAVFRNSIYQVSIWYGTQEPFGDYAHLSFKTHDRQARHDWREMQLIKNELCGPECEAIEIYPAESRLVDTCNQYHLFVFRTFRLPLGFDSRLVGDGSNGKAKQRPWKQGAQPPDAKTQEQMEQLGKELVR